MVEINAFLFLYDQCKKNEWIVLLYRKEEFSLSIKDRIEQLDFESRTLTAIATSRQKNSGESLRRHKVGRTFAMVLYWLVNIASSYVESL